MALTDFTALQTETAARGFDYLADGGTGQTRLKAWINEAYMELCDEEDWPFLETSATGAPPVSITDLGRVELVQDTTQTYRALTLRGRRELGESFGDLSTTGSPVWYYVTAGNAVQTYPVGGTLKVYYWKVPALLSAGGDVPVVPERFRDLIVAGAVRRAYLDKDNFEAAQGVEAERQNGLEVMRQRLLATSRDVESIPIPPEQ